MVWPFSKKNRPDSSGGSTEAREKDAGGETVPAETSAQPETDTGNKTASAETSVPPVSDEPMETAEQQVNSVDAETRSGPAAQSDATAQAPQDGESRPAKPTINHGPYQGRFPICGIVINHDHHGNGRGEDAPALWRPGLIGAFDGLGGAGGELISFEDGTEQTSAWLGSRLVRNQVRDFYESNAKKPGTHRASREYNFFEEEDSLPEPFREFDFTTELRRVIQEKLNLYARKIRDIGGGSSRIRSKLIKILPTTLAVCTYDLDKDQFTAVWAGDSRVFYLRPGAGLLQVTTDDLRTHADALKNLTEDFVLHERLHDLQPRSILLAATDGCFGYVQTPLHFEHLLLSTMQQAADWEDWQNRLEAGIVRVTGDDSTLAAAIIGWSDFAECRESFRDRADWCEVRVKAYNDAHERVKNLDRELDQARKDLAQTTSSQWEEYRRSYEMPAETPTRDVPPREQAGRPVQAPAGADHPAEADRP
jgi:serine/threonine protein phosphatase PrpC